MIEIKHRKSGRPLYRAYTDSLEGIDLRGAQLGRAELAGANLRGADLSGAYLDEANLAGADLAGASLRHCFLQQTDLTSARLQGSDLSGSLLRRTRLADADLAGVDLSHATYSRGMRWPAGFDAMAAGALPEEREPPDVASLYVEILGHVRRHVLAWHWHNLKYSLQLGLSSQRV